MSDDNKLTVGRVEFGPATTDEKRTGFDRRGVDKFLGTSIVMQHPQSLTTADLKLILAALHTGEEKERAIALLDVAIALGDKAGRI